MKIVNVKIDNFGTLSQRSFDFGEAINIIRGDNESGKSTLLLFIKFMLYGLAKKARGASVSEADRAISWDSDEASGSMTVSFDGKLYRIDRRARRGRQIAERMQVVDCETETVCENITVPGEYFLGIPVDVFESSCLVAQLRCTSVDGEQVSSVVENLLSSADESIDTARVLKTLDMVRVKFLHKDAKGGSIFDLESQKSLLENSYRKAINDNHETERLKSEIARTDENLAEVSKKKQLADELDSKIKLRSTVELFDLLHTQESKKAQKEEQRARITENIRNKDLIPDEIFLTRLKNVKREIEVLRSELSSEREGYDKKLSELRADEATYQRFRAADAEGGIGELRKKFGKAKGLNSVCLAVSVLSAAVCVGAGAVAALVTPKLWVVSAIAFIALILSVVGQIKAKGTLKAISKILNASTKEIAEFFEGCAEAEKLDGAIRAELAQADARILIKERMLREGFERACAFLAPFAEVDGSESDKIWEVLTESVEKISEYIEEYVALSAEINSLSAEISNLSSKLSEYNEHQTRHKVSDEIFAMSDEEIAEAQKKKSFYDYQLKVLNQKKLNCDRRLIERRYTTQNPFDIAVKLEAVKKKLEEQTADYRALVMAIDAITSAAANMRNTVTPRLRAFASEYIAALSGEKYGSVGVTDKLDVSMTSQDGFFRPVDAFSAGTRDAVYLALRLAVLKLLPTEEGIPLMLDETLAMIDSRRAANILRIISNYCGEGGQCLFFSCHDREERLCRECGLEYNLIEM